MASAWINTVLCVQGLAIWPSFSMLAFTKLLRPLIRHWYGQGLRALLYLDDGIVAVSGKDAADKASGRVREDLAKVEHTAKCSWVPSQEMSWLGFHLDLSRGVISVQEESTSINIFC